MNKHHEEFSLLPVVMGYAPLLALAVGAIWSRIKNKTNNEKENDHEHRDN